MKKINQMLFFGYAGRGWKRLLLLFQLIIPIAGIFFGLVANEEKLIGGSIVLLLLLTAASWVGHGFMFSKSEEVPVPRGSSLVQESDSGITSEHQNKEIKQTENPALIESVTSLVNRISSKIKLKFNYDKKGLNVIVIGFILSIIINAWIEDDYSPNIIAFTFGVHFGYFIVVLGVFIYYLIKNREIYIFTHWWILFYFAFNELILIRGHLDYLND